MEFFFQFVLLILGILCLITLSLRHPLWASKLTLSEVHREFSQPLHVAYVNLKAAFDSVDRLTIWKALRGIGIPQYLLTSAN